MRQKFAHTLRETKTLTVKAGKWLVAMGEGTVIKNPTQAVKWKPGEFLIVLGLKRDVRYGVPKLDGYRVLAPDGQIYIMSINDVRRHTTRVGAL